MAIKEGKKHNVSDPGEYDPLIADRKKRVRRYRDNAKEWLELGRLHHAKRELTDYLAKRHLGIRYSIFLYIALVGLFIPFTAHRISTLHLPSWLNIGFTSAIIIIPIIILYLMWSLRYPESGAGCFRKAIGLDPDCGEAYAQLGMIALGRHQKHRACRYFEQAVRLNDNNPGIKRELKSIYEKEFMTFFNRKTEKEIEQHKTIETQLEQIRGLRSKISSLEKLTESLNDRVGQVRWNATHKEKSLSKEMAERISTIHKDYEEQIAAITQDTVSREEAKESAEKNFIRLTTEIMEAKAELEEKSLAGAAGSVEDIMGIRFWQALSENTRTYLATSEQVSSMLTENGDKPDYSLVGIELCKALENEINRTLVQPFIRYLDGNGVRFLKVNQTGENKGKPFYFTYLAKVVDAENYPKFSSLTLGQYHFVLSRTLDGEYALKEYGDYLDKITSTSGTVIGKTFLKKLEIVTKRYRNEITHKSPLSKNQYHHLKDLIFSGEAALLRACCKIALKEDYQALEKFTR